MDARQGIAARFTWHPEYAGRLLLDVREELVREIAADQRAYALAMEAAESREDDALASVLRLEKRWSTYDLDGLRPIPASLRIAFWNGSGSGRNDTSSFPSRRCGSQRRNEVCRRHKHPGSIGCENCLAMRAARTETRMRFGNQEERNTGSEARQ